MPNHISGPSIIPTSEPRGYYFSNQNEPSSVVSTELVGLGDELWVMTPLGPKFTGWTVVDAPNIQREAEALSIEPGTIAQVEVDVDGAAAQWLVFMRAPNDCLVLGIPQ